MWTPEPNRSDKQVRTPNELYKLGLYDADTTPPDVLRGLIGYCARHDLVLSQNCQQAFAVYHTVSDRFRIYVSVAGFDELCMRTGLWMPGEEWVEVCDGEVHARAYCWRSVRQETTPNIKVGVTCRLDEYYGRSCLTGEPERSWQIAPHARLMQAAHILAARKALGSLVANFRTVEGGLNAFSDPSPMLWNPAKAS